MFDDFSQSETSAQARKRLRSSIAAAILVYGTCGTAIVAATATVRKVVEEQMTQVEFAPPPEPEPEPPPVEAPPPKAASTPRPKVKRAALAPPDKVPLEKPKESNAELAEAGEAGPVDGFLDGVEGGTGTGRAAPPPPPPPKPEKLTLPVAMASVERPLKYPKAAERKGIEGVVTVAFEVLENGTCINPKIVNGPVEFHETVLKAVATWRYRPAMRGGKPVRHRMSKRVVFRLEDA